MQLHKNYKKKSFLTAVFFSSCRLLYLIGFGEHCCSVVVLRWLRLTFVIWRLMIFLFQMYAECSWSDTDASPFFNYHLRSSNSSPENLSAIRISGFRAALDPLYGYPSVVVSACERDAGKKSVSEICCGLKYAKKYLNELLFVIFSMLLLLFFFHFFSASLAKFAVRFEKKNCICQIQCCLLNATVVYGKVLNSIFTIYSSSSFKNFFVLIFITL